MSINCQRSFPKTPSLESCLSPARHYACLCPERERTTGTPHLQSRKRKRKEGRKPGREGGKEGRRKDGRKEK